METTKSDAAACGSYPAPDCSTCKHFFYERQVWIKTHFEEVKIGFFKKELLSNTTHEVVVVEECRRFPNFIRKNNRIACGEYQSNPKVLPLAGLAASSEQPVVGGPND